MGHFEIGELKILMPTVCQAKGDEKLPPEPQTGEDIVIPDHNSNVSQIIMVRLKVISAKKLNIQPTPWHNELQNIES